jgi:8-oxo-dGTP pyrophosphatase MutT (NUDIX family)
MSAPGYDKIALLVIRDGRILLCRKRHSTSLLILPGGCREPGESALECLERELREELGDVKLASADRIGAYSDHAAGDPTKTVRIELYLGELIGTPAPHSEIAELIWFAPADDWSQLAPSLANKILPDLIARQIIPAWVAP